MTPQRLQSGADPGGDDGGHGGRGVLMMIACCVPMVAIFVLIALDAV